MASAKTKAPGVFPVIMAGGSGTRFWPLSRASRPKQFLPLATNRPLIVETLARLKGLATPKQTFVVCGAVHAPMVRKALPSLPRGNVLVEPQARNTAPAIALATAAVAHVDPQGVLVVLPSDQHVADVPAFQASVNEAVAVARAGHIVTLGIHPTRPETGYGYIQVGEPLSGTARRVSRFAEKPDRATAEQYVVSGEYLWNAGLFVFRADVMLEAFKHHMPALSQALEAIRAAWGTGKAAKVLAREFLEMPATSIDYGVAEKATNIAVVPSRCGWSDVGSFNALPEVRPTDESGNVSVGKDVLLIDSAGCVVVAKDKPIAVVGMKDVVVVDAGDAMLVLPKEKSQDVRKVVEALKAKKRLALL
ncbi:MAG: mannose-1-phosphate guanylyltransferase [Myxococcaceae bacterium]|nr:mannose-1-phosphate guanylyltransferase [Myxococcaceae bacterium]